VFEVGDLVRTKGGSYIGMVVREKSAIEGHNVELCDVQWLTGTTSLDVAVATFQLEKIKCSK